MQDDLVYTMLDFGSAIRPYMAAEIRRILDEVRLDERDLSILDVVAQHGPLQFGEIAEHLQVRRKTGTSVSRISNAAAILFSEHGVIKKEVNPKDQRQHIAVLTPKGRQILDRVEKARTRVYEEIRTVMDINDDEALWLRKVFEQAADNFRKLVAQKRTDSSG